MSCDYLTAQYIVFGNLPRQPFLVPQSIFHWPRRFFIDFVDDWLHLSIAQASLALRSVCAAILHSSFFILHSSFFILHSSFFILHSSFFIQNHSSLRVSDLKVIITLHFSLITLHSELFFILHSSFFIFFYTLQRYNKIFNYANICIINFRRLI